jgi:ubiquinone/menaquinone biosynthesis C-methylase UbiE
MDGWLLALLFAAIWIITFWPAWRLFMILVAEIVRPHKLRWGRVVWIFVLYRLIIAAPYIVVLILGQGTLGPVISGVLIGLVVLGLVTSFLRLFATQTIANVLWRLYALTYDGLRYFYPYRHLLQLQIERVKAPKQGTIIDLGCGSGNMLPLLTNAFPEANIIAVDPTAGMLKRAQRKAKGITFMQQDGLAYLKNQPDASADAVIMSNVLYTITDRSVFWPELLRVLKPNGMAVITNSDRAGSAAIIKEHLTHDSWIKLLHPTLIMTGIIDGMISELSKVGTFHFVGLKELEAEVAGAGGKLTQPVRCYGGDKDGVNLLFTVTR